MSVIPFPPRPGHASEGAPDAGGEDGFGPGTPSLADRLAEAEAKVAMLERTLWLTARENAQNRTRAERAEATLARLRGDAPE